MIIRLRRIQRSPHSITSATLMSPTVSCFLLHCTDSYNHAIGGVVVHAAFPVSVRAHTRTTRRRPVLYYIHEEASRAQKDRSPSKKLASMEHGIAGVHCATLLCQYDVLIGDRALLHRAK